MYTIYHRVRLLKSHIPPWSANLKKCSEWIHFFGQQMQRKRRVSVQGNCFDIFIPCYTGNNYKKWKNQKMMALIEGLKRMLCTGCWIARQLIGFHFWHNWPTHSVIVKFIKPLTDKIRRCVMIVDDTFLGRTRSKNVELASLVHDHTDGSAKGGSNCLHLAFLMESASFLWCSGCLLPASSVIVMLPSLCSSKSRL